MTNIKTAVEIKTSSELKPFIRWAGGKQKLINEIFSHLKLENVNRYFEPFLGGGSFYFKGDFNHAVLSDLNPNLINCYQQIRDDVDAVYDGLMQYRIPVAQETYYRVREEFNFHNGEQSVEQAVRFIFLNRTSFNGIYRVNKKGLYNVPFGKENPAFTSIELLRKISEKLANVEMFNGYYEEIQPMLQENDLVYLDPPYPKLSKTAFFNNYTLDKFDDEEQVELANFANEQSANGVKIVISNADIESIRELYNNNWKIIECSAYRVISCKKKKIKVKELIIKNF